MDRLHNAAQISIRQLTMFIMEIQAHVTTVHQVQQAQLDQIQVVTVKLQVVVADAS